MRRATPAERHTRAGLLQAELFELGVDAPIEEERDRRTRLSKAGEFIAAAELTVNGFDVTLAAEKLSYDLLADLDGRIFKVQVKAASYNAERQGYRFCTNRCSHKAAGKSRPYTSDDVDLFAFVAVDIRAVVFFPVNEVVEAGIVDLSRRALQPAGISASSLQRSVSRLCAA
jgi:PD-(D/E)XK endonuclease